MEILLERNHGFVLIIKAENVNVCEDIEERIYGKTEYGKTDFRNVKRDVKTEVIKRFVSVLEDMIHYREADFDSSYLIEQLFDKLPQQVANDLLLKLEQTL